MTSASLKFCTHPTADSHGSVDSSTAGPGRHHGRPGKWENRGLLGSSLDRVLDNDASLMLTTVWKRGKPAKMAVRAQENRACGAKKRRASRATRGLKRRPCGRPHTPVGESSFSDSAESSDMSPHARDMRVRCVAKNNNHPTPNKHHYTWTTFTANP